MRRRNVVALVDRAVLAVAAFTGVVLLGLPFLLWLYWKDVRSLEDWP